MQKPARSKGISVGETILGVSETILGVSETNLGISETILGVSETILGVSETILGVSETISGVSEKVLWREKTSLGREKTIPPKEKTISATTFRYSLSLLAIQDSYASPSEPTDSMTFSSYGITDFDVQYWNGSAWVTVSGGSVTNNDKVWRKFTFAPVTTSKIRVVVNNALASYSRIAEVEAWSGPTGSVFENGNLPTTYEYNHSDELVKIDQGEQERLFKYDSLGRLVRQKLAEQTATINDAGTFVGSGGSGATWSDSFVYDVRSNLTQRTDARGVKTNFSYQLSGSIDPLNRLQGISYDTSTADTTYTINAAASVSLEYMTTGDKMRVKKVITSGTAEEENSYDSEGRISEYKLTLNSGTSYPFVTGYLYDTASRLTEVRYPAQYGMSGNPRKEIEPGYDVASRLTQLNVDSSTQLNDIVYNTMSQVTSLKTGHSTSNPRVEAYSYDAQTGLLTGQTVKNTAGSTTYLDLSYGYSKGNSVGTLNGKTGQLTSIVDNLDHNKDRVYEHDALGRLIKAKGGLAAGASSVTADWTQDYSYDRYGNKTGTTASGITADSNAVPTDGLASLSYDTATNRITPNGPTGWQYDLAGNLIRGQNASGVWQRFEYDAAGRLVKVKDDSNNVLETYTYGASRTRLKTETSTQRTYYAWGGSWPLVEYTEPVASTTPAYAKSYVYAGSRLLSTATNNSGTETIEFHHPDRLGTKLITNASSGASYQQSTLPFGTFLSAEEVGTGSTNQKFTSYDRSSSTGLDYAMNRTYSSGQGRFNQVDPIGMAATSADPQSLNLYSYVQNVPIDFVDPSGLMWIPVCNLYALFYVDDGTQVPDSEHCHWTWVWIPDSPPTSSELPGDGGQPSPAPDPPSSQLEIPKNCADALSKVGLLKKVQNLLKTATIYDVNKIQNEAASKYFDGAKGLTVGQYFDNVTGGKIAYTYRAGSTAKGTPTGKTGIYARGGAAGMPDSVRLHETVHLAQPKTNDLDKSLASLLKVDTKGKDPGDALDDYFNSGCDPSLLIGGKK